MFHRDNGNKINCKITRVCSFLLATCASKVKVKMMKSSLIQNRKFNPNPFPLWDGGLVDCFPFLIFIAPHRIVDVYGYGIIFDCWCKWHHIFHICGNFLNCEERRCMNWLWGMLSIKESLISSFLWVKVIWKESPIPSFRPCRPLLRLISYLYCLSTGPVTPSCKPHGQKSRRKASAFKN